jgi:hypothetical protein
MVWFVLKNRRHVGPFEESHLAKLVKSGEVKPQDFVISQENAELGELKYVKVSEAFPSWVPSVPKTTEPQAPSAQPAKSLGEFSEEEILTSEVSRIFMESLDSGDLIKGSSEFTRTGVTQTKAKKPPPPTAKMSRYNPLDAVSADATNTPTPASFLGGRKTAILSMLGFAFLVLAAFPIVKKKMTEGSVDVTAKSSETPVQTQAEAITPQEAPAIRVPPTIRVPELTDERTRRLELEREREQEKREREILEERERNERKLSEDHSDKEPGGENSENLGAKDPEVPTPENENSEIAESDAEQDKTKGRTPATESDESAAQ